MPDQTDQLDPQTKQLQELLEISKTVVVIVRDQPSFDHLATAATLSQSLMQMGKEVHFLTPGKFPQTDPVQHIAGLESIQHKMGNQNLVVSFEYSETQVDKVSYHIGEESGKFFLTVKPQKGHPPLDSSKVEFSYTGMDADLAFLVGIHDLETLENLYFGHESFYSDVPLVTIHNFEPDIGLIKFDFSQNICLAEGLVFLLQDLGVSLTAEMASNLLLSIEEKTAGLTSSNTTADTFDAVADLLRSGARRYKLFTPEPSQDHKKTGKSTSKRSTSLGLSDENSVFEGEKQRVSETLVSEQESAPTDLSSQKKVKDIPVEKAGRLNHQPSGFRS